MGGGLRAVGSVTGLGHLPSWASGRKGPWTLPESLGPSDGGMCVNTQRLAHALLQLCRSRTGVGDKGDATKKGSGGKEPCLKWGTGSQHSGNLKEDGKLSRPSSPPEASALVSCHPFCSRTRATSREEKNLQGFLEQPKEKWVESAFEVDGPHYFTVLALHILPPEKWRATRVEILRRLLVTSQARAVAPGGATRSVPVSRSCLPGCLSPGLCPHCE